MSTIASNAVGLGIRPELFAPVLEQKPAIEFFEAHSENYFGESLTREKLLELRADYPVSLHGVGLSLGRADNLDSDHLRQLANLVAEVEPVFVSEHLAWSAYSHIHLPDLLPLPLTHSSMRIMIEHVEQMQETLGRQILVENPSNYLAFDQMDYAETDFLNELAHSTGCGLLLDINNVYVSSVNLQRDPLAYIHNINPRYVKQLHLAGHTETERDGERVLIDTHNKTVRDGVWQLLDDALEHLGPKPGLIEWDSDFPEFSVLLEQCDKAASYLKQPRKAQPTLLHRNHRASEECDDNGDLARLQSKFLTAIMTLENTAPAVEKGTRRRISVYQHNVDGALVDYMAEAFPAVKGVVGEDYFTQMVRSYYREQPPSYGNIYQFGSDFAQSGKYFDHRALPYLSDLAKLEWLLHSTYFAKQGVAVDMRSINQQQLMTMPVVLCPSMVVLESSFPIVAIHSQSLPSYQGEVAVDLTAGGDKVIIFKMAGQAQMQRVEKSTLAMISAIQASGRLLDAIERCSATFEQDELGQALGLLLGNSLIQVDQSSHKNNNEVLL